MHVVNKVTFIYRPAVIFAVFALLSLPGAALADIFMYRDNDGIVYFTDTPPKGVEFTMIKRYAAPSGNKAKSTRRAAVGNDGRYDTLISHAARKHKVDPSLIKSVIKVESDFDRFSISSKGARGLMQLMPDTARLLKVRNVFDPAQNIDGGTRYLGMMLKKFGGDLRLALAAYNAGPNAVKKYGGTPPYPETIRYIQKVYTAYRWLTGGATPPSVYTRDTSYSRSTQPAVYYAGRDGGGVFTDRPVGRRITLD